MNEKENQLLRVILQQLETLGFTNTVAELQTESGVLLHSDPIVNLTSLVLNGDWEMAQDALVSLQLGNINEILFLIRCHVYIELLYNSNLHMALDVLQNLVTPVASDNVLLHKLSSLLFLSIDSIPVVYNFDTDSNNNGRANLLSRLKLLVSPHIMLPDNRLQVLIDQALEYQKSNCLFHNSLDKPTCLLTNHVCDRSVFPTKASMIFNHSDEVWFTVFSHNGLYLASASKDNSCMIWDITTVITN